MIRALGFAVLATLQAPAPQVFELRWSWPASGALPVREVRQLQGYTFELTGTLRWHPVDADGALTLVSEGWTIERIDDKPAYTPELAQLRIDASPRLCALGQMRIDANAAFAEMQGYEEALSRTLAVMRAAGELDQAGTERLLVERTQPAARWASEKALRDAWEGWVGAWNNQTLALGQELSETLDVPIGPEGKPLPAERTYLLTEALEHRGAACVRATRTTIHTGAKLAAEVALLLGVPSVESARREQRLEALFEPAGLRPHHVTSIMRLECQVAGEPTPRTFDDRREFDFDWRRFVEPTQSGR